MESQKFCLKWDGFQSTVTSLFDSLRQDNELVDITLCCEGQRVRAHRMMLSACSPYFRELLKANQYQQMAIFLKDTSAADLNAVIEFMYKGSVNVSQNQLPSFIKTAEMLQIRGLSGEEEKGAAPPSPRRAPPPAVPSQPQKRRRLSGGSAGGGRRSPVSPGRRPRTPTPPPPAVPPPPLRPPAGAAPSVTSHRGQRVTSEQHAPPPMPAVAAAPLSDSVKTEPENSVKVEKIDLTEDDDASLDSALYNVADYEGSGGHSAEYDESYDGSNSGMDHMTFMSPEELEGVPSLGAGPSQGPPLTPGSQSGEDGSASGRYACDVCGRQYGSRDSMTHHRKIHTGLTTCQLCGNVFNRMQALRRHLRNVHNMSAAQTRALAPHLQRTRQAPT